VLTDYWINEGADVLYDIANNLGETDLITTARFARPDGTEGHVDNITYANATLQTIVPGSNDDTELRFNGNIIGDDVWMDSNIATDQRYVTEYLLENDNIAEFQYEGSGSGNVSGDLSMMSSNAFLFVRYPPDLEPEVPTQLNANAGASYNIPITIHNWGRSKAKNFNVIVTIVTIDGNEVLNKTIPIPEIKGAGQEGDNVTINIPEKAPAVEGIITHNVTVVVDPEDKVPELINKYGRGIKGKSNGEEKQHLERNSNGYR